MILALSAGEFVPMAEQYLAQFDGVIVARTDFVHYPPWTRNLATRYVVQESGGRRYVYYADPSQGHIDGFAIGTHLAKRRWRMDYEADGAPRNDFPLFIYVYFGVLDLGLLVGCIIVAFMIQARDRRTRELEAAVERGEELLRKMDRER